MSLLSLTAVAQKPMTLRECIDYALNRNVQVKQSALQRQQEEVNLSTAKNARLPEVSGGANQSFSFGRGLTAQASVLLCRSSLVFAFLIRRSKPNSISKLQRQT